MDDLVRRDVVHFYHLIETSGEKASDVRVKGEGCDSLLVVGQSTNTATAGIQVPDAQDGAGGGQCDGAGWKHEDLFDGRSGGGGSAHEELTLTGPHIKKPHGCVIGASEDEMGI